MYTASWFIIVNVAVLLLQSTCVSSFLQPNLTELENFVEIRNKYGQPVLIDEGLMKRLDAEQATWHWTPWLRTRTQIHDGIVLQVDCFDSGDSIDSFPDGIFTDEQLRQGAFLLYLFFGVYSFTLLAIVCNDYFLPCVEFICEDLNIPQNIGAATFMSVATSCPEFFVNVISTFLTESTMGIGTIVGSALFNILGVAAVGSIAAIKPISLESGPVTRDVIMYMINVSVLVAIVWDGQIDWKEAVVLGVMYVLYFVFMFNSVRIFNLFGRLYGSWCIKKSSLDDTTDNKSIEEGVDNKGFDGSTTNVSRPNDIDKNDNVGKKEQSEDDPKDSLFKYPTEKSISYRIWWLYTWPLKIIMQVTIPSPMVYRKCYPLSFIMCIVWIGVNSYFVSWSMTVIGSTFMIPDSVMGMTFLAFGGCLPEAFSIFIMSRKGEGGIGVSNALGANSLAILFALGVPWLIKTLTLVVQGAENTSIIIDSSGIDFVIGSLLVAVALLWITLYFGKFKLRKCVGIVLSGFYVIFITFAILVELGILLDRTITRCFV
ncbi:hypothetical protein ACJJTC_000649 [Scirpophaga incertulas]